MFRLRKSCIFLKVSKICYDILKNQLDPSYTQLVALSQHCAMAVIRTLNNNIKSKNKISAESTLNEFYNVYGNSNLVPSNIYQILLEEKILNLRDGFFSYVKSGVFNYYFLFSKDLMPIFKETSEDIEKTINNSEAYSLMCVLEDPEFIDVEYFVNYNNFNKFRSLLKDWSDPEQYFDFENSEMQEFYCFQTDRKIMYNDKLFHCLLINKIGLTCYYFNSKTNLDNIYYYINTQGESHSF